MAETTNNKVVRLETQMTNVETKVDKLDVKLDRLITKVDQFTNLQNEIVSLKDMVVIQEKKIEHLEDKTFRNGWLFPTLSAIFGAVVSSTFTWLIIQQIGS